MYSKAVRSLLNWAEKPVPAAFPYSTTVGEVRRRGKHFVDQTVLEALAHTRRCAVAKAPFGQVDPFLEKFLDVVLDKYDDKYNYLTYTALPLLESVRPAVADDADPVLAQHVHDVTVCSIISDALRFELNQLEGGETFLPELPPDADLIERRLKFALRSIEPSLIRLGFDVPAESASVRQHSEKVLQFCGAQQFAHSRFILDVSMMPVYVVHDEYLFIRILQALDATFSSVCGLLRQAIRAFDDAPRRVPQFILAANAILDEGLKHFLTLSTMQKESFATFREFTTGASAIQSVNYKTMESLCRHPDKERLEGLAYSSVPGLQKTLREGGESIDDKFAQLRQTSGAERTLLKAIDSAMCALSETMTRWRHSHYGIAKKYLGDGSGTGYTEGTPYLKSIKDLAVFTTVCPMAAKPSRQH
jgi:tryptophan 2,3-dioxygenase